MAHLQAGAEARIRFLELLYRNPEARRDGVQGFSLCDGVAGEGVGGRGGLRLRTRLRLRLRLGLGG